MPLFKKHHQQQQDQTAQQDFTSGPTGPATGRSGINDQAYGQDNSYQQPTGPAGGVGGQGDYGGSNMAGIIGGSGAPRSGIY
ncbi:hypothetical protein JAAARDRAFT_193104 [Jaapia argillacea MUCL 33604]|uniref:Uncharacterized protein n=1 Tax=Jaapia argillacea MUCL 33604 TaxID=933084 RepID=A0A067PXD9_9AGAM|nr:hypothetical protein JAAARDRAFT_193104 [Jaapia argillacea MUCL 33604]